MKDWLYTMRSMLLATAILAAVGAALAFGWSLLFVCTSTRTSGEITRLAEREVDGQTVAYAVVEFDDAQGKRHIIQQSIGFQSHQYGAGDKVPVLYLPNNPQVAKLDNFSAKWLFPIALAVMSVMTSIMFIIWRCVESRIKPKSWSGASE